MPKNHIAKNKFLRKTKDLKEKAEELSTSYNSEVAVITHYPHERGPPDQYASPDLPTVLNRHGYVDINNNNHPITMVENAFANLNVEAATSVELLRLQNRSKEILSIIKEEEERRNN